MRRLATPRFIGLRSPYGHLSLANRLVTYEIQHRLRTARVFHMERVKYPDDFGGSLFRSWDYLRGGGPWIVPDLTDVRDSLELIGLGGQVWVLRDRDGDPWKEEWYRREMALMRQAHRDGAVRTVPLNTDHDGTTVLRRHVDRIVSSWSAGEHRSVEDAVEARG